MDQKTASTANKELLTPSSDTIGDPLTKLEFDNVVGYKLSDAIRDGAQGVRQEIGGWGDGSESSCALTAARVAVEGKGYGLPE
jgi:hypothetical protein